MEIAGPENPQIESQIRPDDARSSKSIRSLYRGIWAENLDNNQELPVGGSFLNDKLNINLELDFFNFESQLINFTERNVKERYEQGKDSLIDWLNRVGSHVDPYTYFVCYQVQRKMEALLEVDPDIPTSTLERRKLYKDRNTPKLSELKGKSECAERAALGKYLLQRIGLASTYASGITMQNAEDTNEYPEDHSFIVLKDPTTKDNSLIFDIARPKSQHNLPRILKTDVPFVYELLRNKKDLLVGATEVLQGGRFWFGVGDSVAEKHKKESDPEIG